MVFHRIRNHTNSSSYLLPNRITLPISYDISVYDWCRLLDLFAKPTIIFSPELPSIDRQY